MPKSTRAQSLPNSDNIWGRRSSVLPSLNWKKTPEIQIRLSGEQTFIHSYSTFDEITGHVDLKFERDTIVEDLAICFQGQTNTWVEKITTTSPMMGRSTGKHTFVRVQQPIDQSCLPTDGTALAGVTYSIPFHFVVPERILDFTCGHRVDQPHIKDCHLLLPPSVGDPMLSGHGNTLMDDLCPKMAKINYTIRAVLLKASPSSNKTEQLSEQLGVRIVPLREELPPIEFNPNPGPGGEKYSLRKEKIVRKGIFKIGKKQGSLVAETSQPSSLKLSHPSKYGEEPVTTTSVVHLRYDPATADEKPPSLNGVTTKLKAYTYFGAAPYGHLPGPDADSIWSTVHCSYPETIDLSVRKLANVDWVKHESGTNSTTSVPTSNAQEKYSNNGRQQSISAASTPSTYSAGTHDSSARTSNPYSRRASTFSAESTSTTSTSSDNDSSASSDSEGSSTLNLTSIASPSTSYHASLPYYTTSIVVPVTLPTSTTTSTITPPQSRVTTQSQSSTSPLSTLPNPAPVPTPIPFKLRGTSSAGSSSKPITFIPTFHSCLISRVYALELSITSSPAPTINMRIPLQISQPPIAGQVAPQITSGAPPAVFGTTASSLFPSDYRDYENGERDGFDEYDVELENEDVSRNDEAIARVLDNASGSNANGRRALRGSARLGDVPEYEDIDHRTESVPPSASDTTVEADVNVDTNTNTGRATRHGSSPAINHEAPPGYDSAMRRSFMSRQSRSERSTVPAVIAAVAAEQRNHNGGRPVVVRYLVE